MMTVRIGITHRPCGACVALVPLADGCRHLPAGPPPVPRARKPQRPRVQPRSTAEMLAAMDWPI